MKTEISSEEEHILKQSSDPGFDLKHCKSVNVVKAITLFWESDSCHISGLREEKQILQDILGNMKADHYLTIPLAS